MDIETLINEKFEKLEQWRVLAFALSCTERVRPIVEAFATRETIELFEKQLCELWGLYSGKSIEVGNMKRELEERPETFEDDSLNPHYYAMRALGILFYTIQIAEGDILSSAIHISTSMLNLFCDIDAFVKECSQTTFLSIENSEIEVQKQLLEIITTDEKQVVFKKLQNVNSEIVKLLRELLPYVRIGNNWI